VFKTTTDPLYISKNTVKHHHHHHFLPAPSPVFPYSTPSVLSYPPLPAQFSNNRIDTDLINSSVLRAIADAADHTSGLKTKK
jgi:hypothetical protein